MKHTDVLQEILRYIDTHIKEKLSVEILAERAGYSPYYFCRRFQCEVGCSIMEYVRNRRLAYAASELDSGRRLIEIAVDYGFETHSGFSKAFRRYFGCPPEIYRAYAAFEIPKLHEKKEKKQFIPSCFMEPKIIVKRAAFKLAGFPLAISLQDSKDFKGTIKIREFREKCKTDRSLEKLHDESFLKNHVEYGICYFHDDGLVYVIGVEINNSHNIPAEYNVYTIPEALFAVFTTSPGDEENFSSVSKDAWQYALTEWLPNSGYEFNIDGTAFELYDDRSMSKTEKVCDIYIPIVKRQL
jgi:AraC family transcriptional regulator